MLGSLFCFAVEGLGLDDGAVDFSAADDVIAGAGFHFEDEKSAFVMYQGGVGGYGCAKGDGLQVIYFDARAYCDRAGGECGLHGVRGGDFHHSDHGGSRKYGRQTGIVMRDCPFERDDLFDAGLEANLRCGMRRRGFDGQTGRRSALGSLTGFFLH